MDMSHVYKGIVKGVGLGLWLRGMLEIVLLLLFSFEEKIR